jgi:hypothetical protein
MKKISVWMLGIFVSVGLLAQTKTPSQKPPAGQQLPGQGIPVTPAMPKITNVSLYCEAAHCSELTIGGQQFGSVQGQRRVFVDGAQVSHFTTWGPSSIVCDFPTIYPTFWPAHHQVYLGDGSGQKISNTFDVVFLYKLPTVEPGNGTPGTEIKVSSWGAGPQAGKSLWMGTKPMIINFWPGRGGEYYTPIRAVVPNLPPGTYAITMHSGAQQVSKSSISFLIK